jgi:hypothetical protein
MQIHDIMKQTQSIIVEELEKRGNKRQSRKKKAWWNETLTIFHQNKIRAYLEYKKSNYESAAAKEEYTYWKRIFRKQQRSNMEMLKDNQAQRLKVMYEKDRNAFWRELKMKTKSRIRAIVPIEQLKSEYEKLFNEKLIVNREQKAIIKSLNEEELNKTPEIMIRIKESDVTAVLKKLKNGKSKGLTNLKP